jgi:phosphoribosylamine--glycine ligase
MGAVSPVPFADSGFLKKVEEQVVKPTLRGLQEEGIHYVGFIFIGLMNTNGEPNVIEYNVRMGDPETEVVFPRISNDFVELFKATAAGELDKIELKVISETAVTSVVVAEGYPEAYKKGIEITIPELKENTLLFHAGTRLQGDVTVTDGGRIMACTGIANTLAGAVRKSQELARNVSYDGKYYRKDIGKDLIPYLEIL